MLQFAARYLLSTIVLSQIQLLDLSNEPHTDSSVATSHGRHSSTNIKVEEVKSDHREDHS